MRSILFLVFFANLYLTTHAVYCSVGWVFVGSFYCRADIPCCPCGGGQWCENDNAYTWRTCAVGNYVTNTPSATQNRNCATCPPGQYSKILNAAGCIPFSTCSGGTYVDYPGSNSMDVVCTTWSTCAAGSYESTPPTIYQDRVCTYNQTYECGSGKYSATQNEGVFSCFPCESNSYRVVGMPFETCSAVTACVAGSTYQSTPPTSVQNRVCTAVTACVAGSTYQSTLPTSVQNRVCTAVTADCDTVTRYESTSPTIYQDRVCSGYLNQHSECGTGRYSSVISTGKYGCLSCGTNSYRISGMMSYETCATCTACFLGATFESTTCTPTSNRVCSAVATCVSGSSYQSTAPTDIQNRVCTACSTCPWGSYLSEDCTLSTTGPINCLTCPPGYTSQI
jgi:hypothetical protein